MDATAPINEVKDLIRGLVNEVLNEAGVCEDCGEVHEGDCFVHEYDMNDVIVDEDLVDEFDDFDITHLESLEFEEDLDEVDPRGVFEDDDEDVDEASGASGVAGFTGPLHYSKDASRRMKKMYSRQYRAVGPELKPRP